MTLQFADMKPSSNFFNVVLFLLSSLVTVPSSMSISSLGLALPNFWRVGQVRNTKCGTNVSNEMLLNVVKYQDYSFYLFWVIKGKPTGGGKINLPLPKLGLWGNKSLCHDHIKCEHFYQIWNLRPHKNFTNNLPK